MKGMDEEVWRGKRTRKKDKGRMEDEERSGERMDRDEEKREEKQAI